VWLALFALTSRGRVSGKLAMTHLALVMILTMTQPIPPSHNLHLMTDSLPHSKLVICVEATLSALNASSSWVESATSTTVTLN
jgi:hypothetical protein